MAKKYFVTQDLETCMKKLNIEGLDVSNLSYTDVRNGIQNALLKAFDKNDDFDLKVIEFQKIKDYFASMQNNDEFSIAIDDGVYIDNPDFNYSSTRTYKDIPHVTENTEETKRKKEVLTRRGDSVLTQKEALIKTFNESGKSKIVMYDDGIFAGDTYKRLLDTLDYENTGFTIDEIRIAMDLMTNDDLRKKMPKITSLVREKNYIDWIDERDWIIGVPLGGATVKEGENIYGVPYFFNRDVAQKKASIPEIGSYQLCSDIYDQNILFRNKINNQIGREVMMSELARNSGLLKTNQGLDVDDISVTEALSLRKSRLQLKSTNDNESEE